MGGIDITDLNGNGPYHYKVNHMHFHSPSEHKFDGVHHDLEMHIVHEMAEGQGTEDYNETLAVVAILFKVGAHSHPFVQRMRIPDFGVIEEICFSELFSQLDKSNSAFMHYKGSLTNPPCAPVVNFVIYKEVLTITEGMLWALKSVWLRNLGGQNNFREC